MRVNPIQVSRPLKLLSICGVALVVVLRCYSVSAQTTIDFENLPTNTVIGPFKQLYGNRGVLVEPQEGIISTTPTAHSGNKVLSARAAEFYTGPFVINFTSGQQRVRFFLGATVDKNPTVTATLRVLNENGNQVAAFATPEQLVPNACAKLYDIQASGPVIRRIEIFTEATDGKGNQMDVPAAIDDLTFEGNPPPSLNLPVVKITNPVSFTQLDTSSVMVQGTVTGDSLSPVVRVTLENPAPAFDGRADLSQRPHLLFLSTTSQFSLCSRGLC